MKHPIKVSPVSRKPVLRKKVKVGDIVKMKHGNPCPGVVTKKMPSLYQKCFDAPDEQEFCRVSWLDGEQGAERTDDLVVISGV